MKRDEAEEIITELKDQNIDAEIYPVDYRPFISVQVIAPTTDGPRFFGDYEEAIQWISNGCPGAIRGS